MVMVDASKWRRGVMIAMIVAVKFDENLDVNCDFVFLENSIDCQRQRGESGYSQMLERRHAIREKQPTINDDQP